MKVVQRGIMKILPGKMAEAMELSKEWVASVSKLGMSEIKIYSRLTGSGDVMRTLVFQGEWDSFVTMATAMDKMFADPEMKKTMAKWDAVTESHQVELLAPIQ